MGLNPRCRGGLSAGALALYATAVLIRSEKVQSTYYSLPVSDTEKLLFTFWNTR